MDATQQPREATEAAVKATMTVQFNKEIAVAVEAEKKRTELVKEELLAMQRTAENLKRDSELRAKNAIREDLTRAHIQKERGKERIRILEHQLAEKESDCGIRGYDL